MPPPPPRLLRQWLSDFNNRETCTILLFPKCRAPQMTTVDENHKIDSRSDSCNILISHTVNTAVSVKFVLANWDESEVSTCKCQRERHLWNYNPISTWSTNSTLWCFNWNCSTWFAGSGPDLFLHLLSSNFSLQPFISIEQFDSIL